MEQTNSIINNRKSFKRKVMNILFRVYFPLCLRIEKFRATMLWRNGVRQCRRMYADIGAPRVYLFFDAKNLVWAPMTYEDNKKMKPALRRLRIMGKLRGTNLPASVEQMKQYSYYYTPSKWGAKGIDDKPQLKASKLHMWIEYYLSHLSAPMRKCLTYKSAHAL